MNALFALLAHLSIIAGVFFMLVAAIGLIRFPDFYSRCHPAGMTGTLGQGLLFFGLILLQGLDGVSVKLALVSLFVFATNPVVTHAMMRTAYLEGVEPWRKGDR